MMKYFFLFGLLGTVLPLKAQNTPTQTKTTPQGVRVTTFITPIEQAPEPSLEQQVEQIQIQLESARKNPQYMQDGTVQKYEKALRDKQEALTLQTRENAKKDSRAKSNK